MGISGEKKHRHDTYFKQARAEGYRARSAYKLKEIQKRFHPLKSGQTVLDLGAAPGSWSQVAARIVGPRGKVVAVDLKAIEEGLPKNVICVQLDVLGMDLEDLKRSTGLAQVNVVLSDMAPNTSGVKSVDQLRSAELCLAALELADRVLSDGGGWVCKIFQGPDVPEVVQALRVRFDTVRTVKPKSSRSESLEVFLVALGYASARRPVMAPVDPYSGWHPLDD